MYKLNKLVHERGEGVRVGNASDIISLNIGYCQKVHNMYKVLRH